MRLQFAFSCPSVLPRTRTRRSLSESIIAKQPSGCNHLFSPLGALFVLSPRKVITAGGIDGETRRQDSMQLFLHDQWQ